MQTYPHRYLLANSPYQHPYFGRRVTILRVVPALLALLPRAWPQQVWLLPPWAIHWLLVVAPWQLAQQ